MTGPPIDGQALAAEPRAHAVVSASAGTGKTYLLTSRVFRLLLGGAAPESLLCLTFTRAGAANMAERIGDKLASWVRMDRYDLARELQALGERGDLAQQEVARTLFARVLDAPGGIRIQTIHAFAQSLLAAFPAEAGIAPGLKPLEGRAAQELTYDTLADLVSEAEASGDTPLIRDIERLSERLGERGAVKYLGACAARSSVMADLDLGLAESRLREAVGVHACDIDDYLAEQCADGAFDCALLAEVAAANQRCGGTKAAGYCEIIGRWITAPPSERAGLLAELLTVFRTGKREPRVPQKGQLAADPDYADKAERLAVAIAALIDFQAGCRTVADMMSGLRAGKAFAAAYARAKAAGGFADFNDLIAWTRRLLELDGIADWVRYKLDQRIDHVLVDEAQDTNADQWAIIDAIVREFFSGSSETEGRWRTLLAVGDFKQAIFGFQGTDPNEFETMRGRYKAQADALTGAEVETGEDLGALPLHDVSMSRSFRSAQGILDLVDETIGVVGASAMGLPAHPPRHEAAPQNRHLGATIELWDPFQLPETDDEGDGDGEEGWVDRRQRRYATELAGQVAKLIDAGEVLGSTGVPVQPRDIMVLVRSRPALTALIVARLFEAGVPVAGIDRLRLGEPLAVQDLVAAMRFAVQPLDDLNLAGLLVSPLFGWSQEALLDLAWDRKGHLWEALRVAAADGGDAAATHDALVGLLNMADFTSPAVFLETILSGPLAGRRKLFSRLGLSARDPIEELLSTAIAFERDEAGSIERFLAWFRRGELEVARDPAQLANEVRVMTVHGAKGLEAPVVILADAHIDPDDLGAHDDPIAFAVDGQDIPLSRSGSSSLPEAMKTLLASEKAAEREEHMRLLYVAMTRAVERLVVAGLQPKRGGIKPEAWYSKVEQAMVNLGAEEVPGALGWGGLRRLHAPGAGRKAKAKDKAASAPAAVTVPGWAKTDAPQEARPPRPLAPSAIGVDDEAAAPPSAAMRAAARRGTLIHSLLERLPGVPAEERRALALDWLARSGGVDDAAMRAEIADQVCAILSSPDYAALFGPGSLGEAPLAATLPDKRVVAGTVDRLLVEDARVSVIDFKTGRVPASAAAIPSGHRAQMAAYAEALGVIFPGRAVRASLLYTAGPTLFDLAT